MSKKLLFIIESLGGGGTQSVLSTLINEFAKSDFKITLLTFKSKKFDKFTLNKSINRVILQKNNRINFLIYRIFNNIIFIFKLRKFLKNHECKTVLSFINATNILVIIASLGLKKKIIVSERNDIELQNISIYKKLLRIIFYRYASLITSNIQNSLTLMEKYVKKNKLIFLPNPIRFLKPAKDFSNNKKKIILSIGRLNKQKGYDILILAFYEFIKIPLFQNWQLYILGEGPERVYLEKMIINLNLKGSVNLKGYCDPQKYFKIAKIYVQSSIFEGMPNSVLEAMTFKVPVILNNQIRGIKFLAKNKFSCLYFDNDKDDLCNKLSLLAKDFRIRKKLSENALKKVEKLNKRDISKIWLKKLGILK